MNYCMLIFVTLYSLAHATNVMIVSDGVNINSMNLLTIVPDGRTCSIENGDRLIINGKFVRILNAQDRQQLQVYNMEVERWNGVLQEHVQHRINQGEEQRRETMNRVFGPGGSYHRSFTGPYWDSQRLNTPPPTTLPPIPASLLAEVPQIPFPPPPPFCL